MEFNWARREKYPSYLEVDLSFVGRSDEPIPRKHFSRAPWEVERGLIDYEAEQTYGGQDKEEVQKVHTLKDNIRLKSWEKFLDLETLLPNQRVFKFDTDKQGALKLEFSNKGQYLAVACTMQNTEQSSWTIVKIFDVESDSGALKVILSGHHDLIHDMHWSQDDNYMVTASGDGSAKVWKLHAKDKEISDRLDYTENDDKFLLCKPLMHPSFVYSAQVHPDPSNGSSGELIIATACFDQKVRIWKCNIGNRVTSEYFDTNIPVLLEELSVMDPPQVIHTQKQNMYEADTLEDEALALIMRPRQRV